MHTHKYASRADLTALEALQILKDGNSRFIQNLKINRNHLQQVNDTSEGQWPFASVLSCSDSRTSAELLFDQGLGDIFSVRLAGNIASIFAIGSLEYACKYLDTKVILVLGHTQCGAIKAACDNLEDGNIHNILDLINPAVEVETETVTERNSGNSAFVNNVAHNNVHHQIQLILENSEIIRTLIAENKLGIAGGVYDVQSGEVHFYPEDEVFNRSQILNNLKHSEIYEKV
jgi:carbonic anhydrase